MAKSQQSFEKNEREKQRVKKREEKKAKKEERRASHAEKDGSESMMAYIDENGNIVDTPPDPTKKKKIDASSIELGVPKREKVVLSSEKEGRIDFFNDGKGFGFIKENGTGESYFVHINGCIDKIKEGDHVVFELEKGMKGMNAVRVKKV